MDAEDGATRQEAQRKTKGETHDVVREDVGIFRVRAEDAEHRDRWRKMIHCFLSWKI